VWNPEQVDVRRTSADAFEQLYQGSRDRLAWQLFALTGDWQGSLDLVQEAFVRVWVRWDRVSGYDNPEAFVRRVAFNLAKSQWRQRRRTVQSSVPESPGVPPSDPDARRDVVAALGSIPATEREAIVRHYLADEPIDQIAREMRAPVGTVKSWLSRGRARLEASLTVNSSEEVTRG
jgi:RNA polymerase sigma-70 factor (sigma-E family)